MYRIIVNEEIFTLFVSTSQTYEQVLQNLKDKLEINKSYGAYKINIHGINKENVNKIEKALEAINDEIDGSPYVIKTGQAIMVKLFIKRQISNNSTLSGRNDLMPLV